MSIAKDFTPLLLSWCWDVVEGVPLSASMGDTSWNIAGIFGQCPIYKGHALQWIVFIPLHHYLWDHCCKSNTIITCYFYWNSNAASPPVHTIVQYKHLTEFVNCPSNCYINQCPVKTTPSPSLAVDHWLKSNTIITCYFYWNSNQIPMQHHSSTYYCSIQTPHRMC